MSMRWTSETFGPFDDGGLETRICDFLTANRLQPGEVKICMTVETSTGEMPVVTKQASVFFLKKE